MNIKLMPNAADGNQLPPATQEAKKFAYNIKLVLGPNGQHKITWDKPTDIDQSTGKIRECEFQVKIKATNGAAKIIKDKITGAEIPLPSEYAGVKNETVIHVLINMRTKGSASTVRGWDSEFEPSEWVEIKVPPTPNQPPKTVGATEIETETEVKTEKDASWFTNNRKWLVGVAATISIISALLGWFWKKNENEKHSPVAETAEPNSSDTGRKFRQASEIPDLGTSTSKVGGLSGILSGAPSSKNQTQVSPTTDGEGTVSKGTEQVNNLQNAVVGGDVNNINNSIVITGGGGNNTVDLTSLMALIELKNKRTATGLDVKIWPGDYVPDLRAKVPGCANSIVTSGTAELVIPAGKDLEVEIEYGYSIRRPSAVGLDVWVKSDTQTMSKHGLVNESDVIRVKNRTAGDISLAIEFWKVRVR